MVKASRAKFNPYSVLEVSKDADTATIARAYRRKALQCHPDRLHLLVDAEGDAASREKAEELTEMFKRVSLAYEILSDVVKREMYDLGGVLPGEEGRDSSGLDSVTLGEEIKAFYATYRGSPEEEDDIVEAFNKAKGDFKRLVTNYIIMDNNIPDEVDRIYAVVERLVRAKRLTATPAWRELNAESNAKAKTGRASVLAALRRRMNREREEAKQTLAKQTAGCKRPRDDVQGRGLADLQALILSRKAENKSRFDAALDAIEKKYCTSTSQGKGGKKKGRH